MDQETAIQVVLAELRRLERQAVAVSAAAPLPMPPPLPPLLPMPPPLLPMPPSLPPMPPSLPPRLVGDPDILAARGYDAFMAGASYGVPLNIDTVVLTKPRSPLAGDYLAPKRARLDYAERSRPPVPPPTIGSAPGADAMSVHQAIEAMLGAHALDWASTQRRNCRTYLLSPTGRFQLWCVARNIRSIDELTTEAVAGFLMAMLDATNGPGLHASTVAKFRGHLRSLARFQAATPGFGSGLHDIDRIPAPRMPRDAIAAALTPAQEDRILAACRSTRDRLILELFLATGVRVSEMAALTLPNVMLDARPPRVVVRGSVHDPNCTKNGRQRQVPFRRAYASLPRRLSDWIERDRDPEGLTQHQELFLSRPLVPPKQHSQTPLGIYGFERLCTRIGERAGIHFSPHMLRHTWATRLVNAAVQPIHLMEVGGWSSIEMVRRYYTPNDDEILAAIAAAGA